MYTCLSMGIYGWVGLSLHLQHSLYKNNGTAFIFFFKLPEHREHLHSHLRLGNTRTTRDCLSQPLKKNLPTLKKFSLDMISLTLSSSVRAIFHWYIIMQRSAHSSHFCLLRIVFTEICSVVCHSLWKIILYIQEQIEYMRCSNCHHAQQFDVFEYSRQIRFL